MKNTSVYLALVALLCLPLAFSVSSCNSSSDSTTYSEALVTSLSFAEDDSFPGLADASFTIITSTDTGLIYNKDSLAYGTCLDSVIPTFTFEYTPSYSVIFTDSDTVIYSGSDTLNFNARPVRLYVMASDGEHPKWYDIYVNVHQVDPDLYHWDCINSGIIENEGGETRALLLNGTFYFFVNNGFGNSLYTSKDAAHWSGAQTIKGLPAGCSVRNIIEADGLLYYAGGETLYTSSNGLDWKAADYSSQSFRMLNMLYFFNDSVWGIAQRNADQKLQFCNMVPGGKMALTGNVLPDNFPVSDYAALSFASASNRLRAMIVGGYDLKGNSLNTRWNIEWLKGRGYEMADFSIEQPDFESLTGVSIVWYNHEFHMFGSMNASAEVDAYPQLISYDEGLNWYIPDSTKNLLPEDYLPRQKASVIHDESTHYIYIIGGQNRTSSFSDVWRGRLNKTTFLDYED